EMLDAREREQGPDEVEQHRRAHEHTQRYTGCNPLRGECGSVMSDEHARIVMGMDHAARIISISTGRSPLMMNWMPIAPRRRAMTFVNTARPRSPMKRESGTAASSVM